MSREVKLIPSKTYKNRVTMEKSIGELLKTHRHIVTTTDEGRFYPIFIGIENFDLVFHGFCVVN